MKQKLFAMVFLVLLSCVALSSAYIDYDTFTRANNSSMGVTEGVGTAWATWVASGNITNHKWFVNQLSYGNKLTWTADAGNTIAVAFRLKTSSDGAFTPMIGDNAINEGACLISFYKGSIYHGATETGCAVGDSLINLTGYDSNSYHNVTMILNSSSGKCFYNIDGTIYDNSTEGYPYTCNDAGSPPKVNLMRLVHSDTYCSGCVPETQMNDIYICDGKNYSCYQSLEEEASECTADENCSSCMKCDAGTCINQNDTEDTKNECTSSYSSCLTPYLRQGGDGFCSGTGICDTNDMILNVTAGNVCDSGSDANPSSGTNCGIWSDCISGNILADEYYVGYAGDGTATCVDSYWQSAGTIWNTTLGYVIIATEHIDTCSEIDNRTYLDYDTFTRADNYSMGVSEGLSIAYYPYLSSPWIRYDNLVLLNDSVASGTDILTGLHYHYPISYSNMTFFWKIKTHNTTFALHTGNELDYDATCILMVGDNMTVHTSYQDDIINAFSLNVTIVPDRYYWWGIWDFAYSNATNICNLYLYDLNGTMLLNYSGFHTTDATNPNVNTFRFLNYDKIVGYNGMNSSLSEWYACAGFNLNCHPAFEEIPVPLDVCPSGCNYSTIQSAIDASFDGDIVNVDDGTYNENITINKANLILQSVNGAGNTIIDGSGLSATIVNIISNGVTFDGFTVQNGSGVNEYGVNLEGVNGSTIKNLIIKNIAGTVYAFGLRMSYSDGNSISNIAISDLSETGSVYNQGAFGIWTVFSDNNIFTDIVISDITASSDAQGIMLYKGADGNSFDRTTISALTTTGSGNIVFPVGITIYSASSPCNDNTFTDTSISDLNTATNGWSAGIQVRGDSLANTGNIFTNTSISDIDSTGYAYGVGVTTGSSVTFDGGSIQDLSATTSARGFNIWKETSADSSATINNMLISVGTGKGVRIGAGVDASLSKIYLSDLEGNSVFAVENLGINFLNATYNWWGSAILSEIESNISGNVSFIPYYADAGMTILNCGDCSLCMKCDTGTGSCVNQLSSEDTKDECDVSATCSGYAVQEYNGFCDGAGACNTTEIITDCPLCQVCSAGTCANELSSEDLKDDCSQSYLGCVNDYTLHGDNGLCNGAGNCDADTGILNVSAGNVCISGSDVNPTSGTKCGIWSNCIATQTSADEYYVGYAGDGTSVCVDTDWQSAGTIWNATVGYEISVTENADTCQQSDAENPVVSITYPTDLYYLDGTVGYPLKITGTATDNVDVIATWINDSRFTNEGTDTAFDFRNNTGIDDGFYEVTIYSNDSVGNLGSDSVSFYLDTVNPLINLEAGNSFLADNSSVLNTADPLDVVFSIFDEYLTYGEATMKNPSDETVLSFSENTSGTTINYDNESIDVSGWEDGTYSVSINGINHIHTTTRDFSFELCTADWSCYGYGNCNTTNLQACNETIDVNICGFSYAGDYSEFSPLICNYCTSAWNTTLGTCILHIQSVNYTYTNTCCSDTGFPSDCNKPADTTQSCGAGAILYGDPEDLPKAIMDTIVKFLVAIKNLIP